MDKENRLTSTALTGMDTLCRNSIELIQYARKIAAKQINLVQLMTYYALGRWIVEEQQHGEHRAGYGKKSFRRFPTGSTRSLEKASR